ncbi:MAG: fasciclin domain-containing protein [Xenococcus sp. (in: cyanobacteria)]
MQNHKTNFLILPDWLIKSTFVIGLTGMSTLISLPILSQENDLISLFQPKKKPQEDTINLVETLEAKGNFVNLLTEIEIAGLTKQLKDKKSTTTLLAFTDEAFEALPDDIYDRFSQPENRRKILQYHLISETVTREDLQRGRIVTIEGNVIAVSSSNGSTKFNNTITASGSMRATNGVIIQIDQVLFPPDF